MKLPAFVIAVSLLSISTGTRAQADCHQPLKDMLEGTLEHEINNGPTEKSPDAMGGCTLAERLDAPPVFTAT